MSGDVKTLGAFCLVDRRAIAGRLQAGGVQVILPFVVMRRLDCILEESQCAVLKMADSLLDEFAHEAQATLLSGAV